MVLSSVLLGVGMEVMVVRVMAFVVMALWFRKWWMVCTRSVQFA